MANAQISLKQTKMFVGTSRYGVRHLVTRAAPTLLLPCFVVDLSYAPFDKERLVRVATLNDIVDGALPTRALNIFKDVAGTIPAQQGDTLTFSTWPPEWGTGAPSFVVAAPVDDGVKVYEPFWWSAAEPQPGASGLSWELWRSGTLIASGTKGWTSREGGDGLCRTDRFMAVFAEGEVALNHMVSVQTYVNALAENAGMDGTQFEQYPPGNPVETEFPEA